MGCLKSCRGEIEISGNITPMLGQVIKIFGFFRQLLAYILTKEYILKYFSVMFIQKIIDNKPLNRAIGVEPVKPFQGFP